MLQGEAPIHPLLMGLPDSGPACSEIFSHDITRQLHGGLVRAGDKRRQRMDLLRQAGLDPDPFTSIERIDAALCALAAHHLASDHPCIAFGEVDVGLIVVPRRPAASARS